MILHSIGRMLAHTGACLCMLLPGSAQAAVNKKLADSLSSISRQMYAEHNEYFILAEALRDGLIEAGKSYSIVVDGPEITINDKRLTGEVRDRYLKLLQDFYANGLTDEGAHKSWQMESSSLTLLEDLLDPHSDIRSRGPWHHTNRKHTNVLILEELARDGLIGSSGPAHMEYTMKGLTVNGRALTPPLQEKYRMLIRIMDGFVPTQESHIYSINR